MFNGSSFVDMKFDKTFVGALRYSLFDSMAALGRVVLDETVMGLKAVALRIPIMQRRAFLEEEQFMIGATTMCRSQWFLIAVACESGWWSFC